MWFGNTGLILDLCKLINIFVENLRKFHLFRNKKKESQVERVNPRPIV